MRPRRLKEKFQAGLTLIEVSVILSVLAVLSALLIPSLSQFWEESHVLQAQHDSQVIATALMNFMKDTGQSPTTASARSHPGTGNGGLSGDVLVLSGPGRLPAVSPSSSRKAGGRLESGLSGAVAAGDQDIDAWVQNSKGSLADYLQVNGLGLSLKSAGNPYGWNGPYLATALRPDPWGNQYLVNVAFLGTEAGAEETSGRERQAVYVISAGPNQLIETPYAQPVSSAFVYGDDIAVRIR